MFDRTGIIEYDASVASDDAMLDAAIEAGADDVISSESGHEIYASQDTFREVAKALEAKFGEARKAALTWKPQNTVRCRRRDRREAVEADGPPERARRRPERLCQFRDFRRAGRQDGRVGRLFAVPARRLSAWLSQYSQGPRDDLRPIMGLGVLDPSPSRGRHGEGVVDDPRGRGFPFSLCFVHPALALSLRHDIPTEFANPSGSSASTPACAAPAGA